jgi:hypothetical protein
LLPFGNNVDVDLYYSSTWGFCVARFDKLGNSKAFRREASDRRAPRSEPELNFADIDYQYVTSDDLMH